MGATIFTAGEEWNVLAETLCERQGVVRVAHWLAGSFTSQQRLTPRAASIFASQPRWLMGHVASALHLKGESGWRKQDFIRMVVEHGIASRNTAIAFAMEMIKYGFADSAAVNENTTNSSLRHDDVIQLTDMTLDGMRHWYLLHFRALDMLDKGCRVERVLSDFRRSMSVMGPLLSSWILGCPGTRNPRRVYSVFAWADEGGLLLDRLVSGTDPETPLDQDRTPTNILSRTALADGLGLSRTHTTRLMAKAEALGALGWTGRCGHSQMWISREFRHDYTHFQALKLVMFDAAFSTAFPGHRSALDEQSTAALQPGSK